MNAVTQTGGDKTALRPFHVNVPEAELTELRRRINATRWPDRETVSDQTQGVQLAAVLGDRVRLAQVSGQAERSAPVHHRDRWTRHSFHPRAFET
jgi:hypothetical protein